MQGSFLLMVSDSIQAQLTAAVNFLNDGMETNKPPPAFKQQAGMEKTVSCL
jgi:hypothetical protein